MQAMGLSDYLNDPMLINELLNKLPGDMKLDWGRHRMATVRVDIVTFDDWLFGLASCASQVTALNPTASTTGEEKAGRKSTKERVFVHDEISKERASTKSPKEKTQTPPACHQCEKDHNLSDCPDFKAKSRNERWQLIKEKKLCIRCFRTHMVRRCASKQACGVDGCRMAHNALLHGNTAATNHYGKVTKSDIKGQDGSTVLFSQSKFKRAVFRYIPVILYGPKTTISTFALIDEGASCTPMDSGLAEELGLDGPSEELCLRWTGDITQHEASSKFVGLEISARGENVPRYRLHNVRTITDLELPQQ
ncbi:uncharacterized protein LOC118754479 [Rhagoletis pomonella]|uniref:uncharacterized protein LOC118754478 n=1 Tax=Rhagoletis pomonella TaxID=28610 RepID=UPI0017819A06|nr:uncharacterized protein LOC118754478 [Rhagoletis pomonella]XP_036345249.1 uncharacterized protein LOC118754479 [Rhagoletis pomonella]